MIPNTHRLRTEIDDPLGFRLHILGDLDPSAVERTRELNQPAAKRGILQAACVIMCDVAHVSTKKGVFYFWCVRHEDALVTTTNHVYALDLFMRSEESHLFSIMPREQFFHMLAATTNTGGIYSVNKVSGPEKTMTPLGTAILLGNLRKPYYSYVRIADTEIELKLAETTVNDNNRDGDHTVLLHATLPEITGLKENLCRFIDDQAKEPWNRTFIIL